MYKSFILKRSRDIISFIASILFFFVAVMAYRRYYPVKGISYKEESSVMSDALTVLDIRDYHESEKGSHIIYLNIPFAYLKRHYAQIPCSPIHVIAADQLELNLGLRYLKAKGYRVVSYSLKNSQAEIKQKGDICYDVR